jgi:hypothetical protein
MFTIAHRILRDIGRAEDALQQSLVIAWVVDPAVLAP